MICAVIFDLDGTLVQTEKLKAISYARAAVELCPGCATQEEVIEAFKSVTGRPRQEVATTLMNKFGLEDAARGRMAEMGVNAPWKAYVNIRLRIYNSIISDAETLQECHYPYQIALLQKAKQMGLKTALATTTHLNETAQILKALGILDSFDCVATADDVEHDKPDPEIYLLVAQELDMSPDQCIAIEDSSSGAKAAVAAGTHCIVVTTPFTKDQVQAEHPQEERWVTDDPTELETLFDQLIEEQRHVLPMCEIKS